MPNDADLIAHAPTDLALAVDAIEAAEALTDHFYWTGFDEGGNEIECCTCEGSPPCTVRERAKFALAAFEAAP